MAEQDLERGHVHAAGCVRRATEAAWKQSFGLNQTQDSHSSHSCVSRVQGYLAHKEPRAPPGPAVGA